MTVRDSTGDLSGDLATPSPAREGSPEGSPDWLRGSRFWLLQSSDDEEEGVEEEVSCGAEDFDMSFKYFCRTPSPVSGRDIVDDSRELARRTLKRIEKRDAQRMRTMAAMAFATTEGKSSSSPVPLGKSSGKYKILARPVMEPSTFVDDNNGGWTVVRRRHRPPVITGRVHDPEPTVISKNSGLGLAGLRASPIKHKVRWNPSVARNRALPLARSDGDREPRQVKVGADIAGHAFRKLLGFSWRKIEAGEPVWRRRALSAEMNGDGGRGGFNPGRGAFNIGRGGYQGRAGYQGHGGFQGRGGFQGSGGFQGRAAAAPRGRQNSGTSRGGHRGFQGNADQPSLGSGADYVQGESSGSGGMINDNQRQQWGGNYQRHSGYNSGNNFGYGGNQQRWQADRGYQYRPREQPRSGIDADLLQQTVQAVVAAVTAATKVTEPSQSAPPAVAPVDSLTRGFFKLHFEVEEANGSQEVDMVDINNGNDGNDDAHNGQHNKEGGNAMDMDPKGPDEGNASNNGGQDGANINNGIQGMQLHAQPLDEIKIGTINVPLSPSGTPSSVQNSDCLPRVSTLGLPQVGTDASGSEPQSCMHALLSLHGVQQRQLPSCSVLSADSTASSGGKRSQPLAVAANDSAQRTGEPAAATCDCTARPAAEEGSSAAAAAALDVGAGGFSPQRITKQGASGQALLTATHVQEKLAQLASTTWQQGVGGTDRPGLSAPVLSPLSANAASWPQRIRSSAGGGPSLAADARANHWPNDGQSLGPDAAGLGGFSVHDGGVAYDDHAAMSSIAKQAANPRRTRGCERVTFLELPGTMSTAASSGHRRSDAKADGTPLIIGGRSRNGQMYSISAVLLHISGLFSNLANNNEQDASNGNNGVDGMQEQLQNIDAIQIGIMNVKLTPPDSMPRKSASGLPPVGASAGCLHAASGQPRVLASNDAPYAASTGVRSVQEMGEQRVSGMEGGGHSVTAMCGRDDRGMPRGDSLRLERWLRLHESPPRHRRSCRSKKLILLFWVMWSIVGLILIPTFYLMGV
ncbi:hypothetical protein ACQ4PT_044458 [Festuca glaucescens]